MARRKQVGNEVTFVVAPDVVPRRRGRTDDLEIPKELRRPLTASARTRTDSILRQETVHEWIMPDRGRYAITDKVTDLYDDEPSTKETDMAKTTKPTKPISEAAKDAASVAYDKEVAKATKKKPTKKKPPAGGGVVDCRDPKLPVEVNFHADGAKVAETKPFANMQAFIDWFNPEIHVLDGSIADDSTTMVEVSEKPRPAANKNTGKRGVNNDPGGAIPQPEKATTTRGAVVKKNPTPAGIREKKPRGVGFVRHGVRVTPPKPGKPSDHSSLYQAFVALSLSIPAHTKFRAELKKTKGGTLDYEEKGKKYKFDLVELKK